MAAREPAQGSWFGALLGLGVLAVLAFFVGALAGLAWKEPSLLFAYLRGDTTEIAWSTASGPTTARTPLCMRPPPCLHYFSAYYTGVPSFVSECIGRTPTSRTGRLSRSCQWTPPFRNSRTHAEGVDPGTVGRDAE